MATGGGKDSAALCICHVEKDETGQRLIIVDQVLERKPRFVMADVVREWAELLRAYRIHTVTSDGYAFKICADEWGRNKITNVKSENNTAQNYLRALPILMARRARLVDSETARKQFCCLQRIVVAGHESVEHAVHAHDDVACAIAGALATVDSTPAAWIIPMSVYAEAGLVGAGAVGNPPELGPDGRPGERLQAQLARGALSGASGRCIAGDAGWRPRFR
jgi:hypothetical protein